MTELTISRTQEGEPRLTITVTGDAAIFRFAYYLGHGPVDHIPLARRIFRYLYRSWKRETFVAHDKLITGGKVVEYGWHRPA